jgi:hypothetical protein
VVEARVCLCGADDAVDEVGIGYISHYARRGHHQRSELFSLRFFMRLL